MKQLFQGFEINLDHNFNFEVLQNENLKTNLTTTKANSIPIQIMTFCDNLKLLDDPGASQQSSQVLTIE